MSAKRNGLVKLALLGAAATIAWPVLAAEVTPERLVNADKEPQNWLMNHRTYDGQRFSPLDHQQEQRQDLKLAYAVPLGGGARQRIHRGHPARRGRLPLHHRFLGRRLQDRRHVGRHRPDRLAHGPRSRRSRRPTAASRCGAISSSRSRNHPARVIATDKDTGKVVWETNLSDRPEVDDHRGAACDQGQDHRRRGRQRRGHARLDRGARRRDRQAALAQIHGPGARRTRQRDLEGQPQCLADRRRRVWVTGTYDPATNQTIWGTGNPVPMFDPTSRPGDNLYTNSVDLLGSRQRQDELVLPVHAGRHVGLR